MIVFCNVGGFDEDFPWSNTMIWLWSDEISSMRFQSRYWKAFSKLRYLERQIGGDVGKRMMSWSVRCNNEVVFFFHCGSKMLGQQYLFCDYSRIIFENNVSSGWGRMLLLIWSRSRWVWWCRYYAIVRIRGVGILYWPVLFKCSTVLNNKWDYGRYCQQHSVFKIW